MKKIIFVIAIFTIAGFVFANAIVNTCNPVLGQEITKNMSQILRSDTDIAEEWYRSRIPAEYADAFLYYTRDKKEIRMDFYSIMVHESCNFKWFVNRNRDGSYDYGPSQLNSSNLKNAKFRKAYCPKDESHITTKYCYYMVMTIGFYYDLYKEFGHEYAFFVYNGGRGRLRQLQAGVDSPVIRQVQDYNLKIKYLIQKHNQELRKYIEDSRRDHIEQLKIQYSNKNSLALEPFDPSTIELFESNNVKKKTFVSKMVAMLPKKTLFKTV